MKIAYLNGAEIQTPAQLHAALARQLDFPPHYGRNLDALYDLLTENPAYYRIVLTEKAKLKSHLGGYYRGLRHVLADAGVAVRTEEPGAAAEAETAEPKESKSGKESSAMPSCTHQTVDLSLLEETLAESAGVRGSLISILQKTQEIYGYVPIDAVYHISERTGIPPAKILGVATFYSQFRFQAIGKYLIMLCKGTACYVNGADRILEAVTDELGIHDNETTEDGLFSLSVVSCLGCCSLAPVMMINDRTYGSLTPDKVRQILRDKRKEAAQ